MKIVKVEKHKKTNELKVRRARNGYIVFQGKKENGVADIESVIEIRPETEGNLQECVALQKLFWEIMELLGEHQSKHDMFRVRITLKNNQGQEVDENGDVE